MLSTSLLLGYKFRPATVHLEWNTSDPSSIFIIFIYIANIKHTTPLRVLSPKNKDAFYLTHGKQELESSK